MSLIKPAPLLTLTIAVLLAPGPSANAVTFVVENTIDNGTGSLRQAIIDANTNPGEDFIAFNIPNNGPHTIAPQSALPEITDSVTLDGFTQGSQTANPADDAVPNSNPIDQPINTVLKIELDGSGAGFTAVGLMISAANTTVRGLAINRFGAEGIQIAGGRNVTIEGCFIGTSLDGLTDQGNGEDGINLLGAGDCRIGGSNPAQRNLISDNGGDGIDIEEFSSGNLVGGNFIGTDATGLAALGNTDKGVELDDTTGNTIGGTIPELRNLLSGNQGHGIGLQGEAIGNRVQGNYIGTDRNGTGALPNRDDGVLIFNASGNIFGGTEETSLTEGCRNPSVRDLNPLAKMSSAAAISRSRRRSVVIRTE